MVTRYLIDFERSHWAGLLRIRVIKLGQLYPYLPSAPAPLHVAVYSNFIRSCRVQDDIEDTKALLDLVRATQVSSGIREWLKAAHATIGFNEAAKKMHPGTGLWFVKGPAFTTWLEKPGSFLWLVSQDAASLCCAPQPFSSPFDIAAVY
ncbi:hypothetical protein B0J13DRAFT_524680 [Dactylonectria estremocensis]|uniref:Uncharacterized protein n=1 Tax=Dactylonectria estremocensis TaxID=1079267 RepID=A0A9P9EXK0_9HYPO|nr:hypothetical protein B0J13DRAFT_524680 [Dactylonectria estremocensis]